MSKMIGGMIGLFGGACYLEKLFTGGILASMLPASSLPPRCSLASSASSSAE